MNMNLVWLGVKNNVTGVNLRYALQLKRMRTYFNIAKVGVVA
jgi:hypothetical protein